MPSFCQLSTHVYRDLKDLCICPHSYRFRCFVSLGRSVFPFSISVNYVFLFIYLQIMCLFLVKLNSVTLLNSLLLGLGAFLSILWHLLCKKSYGLPIKTALLSPFQSVCVCKFSPCRTTWARSPGRHWIGSARMSALAFSLLWEDLSQCP